LRDLATFDDSLAGLQQWTLLRSLAGELTAKKDEIHFQVRRRRKKGEKGEGGGRGRGRRPRLPHGTLLGS
jgi:hypothetical protein